MTGQIPAVITPDNLQKILGIKSPQSLAKIPIPRCHLYPGSKKYVYLAADVIGYLESQKDCSEIDFDV